MRELNYIIPPQGHRAGGTVRRMRRYSGRSDKALDLTFSHSMRLAPDTVTRMEQTGERQRRGDFSYALMRTGRGHLCIC